MKKLLIILLLIVGCEETTEPEVTACSNCVSGYVKDNQGNALSNAAIIFQYYFRFQNSLKINFIFPLFVS